MGIFLCKRKVKNTGISVDALSIAEEFDEGEWTYLDNIVCIWQDEPQTGVDYLRDKFVGRLSEDSINRIIDKLTTTYPHTNTIPWRQIEGLY